jgi:hypothetical protein
MPGWKVLNLPMEANKGIENLLKQYPKLLDVEEGVDIIITKTKGMRTTYSVSFALNGINIAMTPLSEEERAMEPLDMKRFIFSHPSPRQVFVALNENYQELITGVVSRGAEDYPEEPPIKRERSESFGKTATKSESADLSGEYATPAPVAPPRAAAPRVPAAAAPQPKPAAVPPKPSAPKPPAPKPVAPAPKPEAPPAAPVSDVPTPACFGTCDRSDPQCSECSVINECEAKKNA